MYDDGAREIGSERGDGAGWGCLRHSRLPLDGRGEDVGG